MTPIVRTAFPSLGGMIETVSELNDAEFTILSEEIRGRSAFDNDKERVEDLARKIGLSKETISLLINGLAFLYRQLHVARDAGADLAALLPEIIKSIASEELADEPGVVSRLATLLQKNENTEQWEKAQRLRKGFLNNATEFATLVDARPNFSPDRTQLIGFVPIIQLRLRTDSDQPDQRSLVVQLDPRALKRLRRAVDLAEKKLDVLTSQLGAAGLTVSE
jgi:transcriptional regulator with XRE-family HTH domain